MSNHDQLEIVRSGGVVEFYDLDPSRGITNIGRHPANDIVIDTPAIAPFHAVVDHRRKPYQLVVLSEKGEAKLSGQPVPPNVSMEFHNWDTIELDGHVIVLLEGQAAAGPPPPPAPAAGPPSAALVPAAAPVTSVARPIPRRPEGPPLPRPPVGLPTRPLDQPDEIIVTELSEREWTVSVEQTAMFQMDIVNGGELVAMFEVRVEGLDERWVTISPPQVNLYEGERAVVTIAITPPREPDSRAGSHHFAVIVTSPNYPGRRSQRGATLIVNPYYEFAVGELSPRRQSISWFKRAGQATIPIVNKGNSDALFRLEGADDERACSFEFQVPGEEVSLATQAEMRLSPEEGADVAVSITPRSRRLVALRKRTYSFTITTIMLEAAQMPRMVLGQLKAAPLIGFWHILLMLLLFTAGIVFLFVPGPNPRLYSDEGQRVAATDNRQTLRYNVSRFKGWGASNILNIINGMTLNVKIERKLAGAADNTYEVVGDSLRGPTGKAEDAPTRDVVYRLTVGNWLSLLFPRLARSTTYDVAVVPVLPTIEVTPDRTEVKLGEPVLLSWKVQHADRLVLKTQEGLIVETFDEPEPTGTYEVQPEKDTVYVFEAYNLYTGDNPETDTAIVKAIVPPPVIAFFVAQPEEVVQGTPVLLSWRVLGADTVSLESDDPADRPMEVGPDGPPISRQPTRTTRYTLKAIKKGLVATAAAVEYRDVNVTPAPTPTPTPAPPQITFFTADPATLVRGDDNRVTLQWSVATTTTNVEISSPNLASPISHLDREGSIDVAVDSTTTFVLTAFNQDRTSSKTVQVQVQEPTPTATPTPTPPPTATPIPPPKIFFFKVEAKNSADSSKVKSMGGTPPKYQVVVGTDIKLSWEVSSDAEKVTLNPGSNAFGPGANSFDVLAYSGQDPSSYQLIAQSAAGSSQENVEIEVLPNPSPQPPSNVDGVVNGTDNTITWVWTGSEPILGFRVYRADVPPGDNFAAVYTAGQDPPFEWTDVGAGCGKIYYVVTRYEDVNLAEKETGPSATSWSSDPCP